MSKLSVLIITKNPVSMIRESIESINDLASEIVVIDDNSDTIYLEAFKGLDITLINHSENNVGKQRRFGLKKCKYEWILALDHDEVVSQDLYLEISKILKKSQSDISGYIIPYQNHFLGKPINYGGEGYQMLRLFKRDKVDVRSNIVHEHFEIIEGKVKHLKSKLFHYSYRSISQMLIKFSDYAIKDAIRKYDKGEKSSLKKIFLYPIHMFYARFIKDKGYKDGLFRIPLDLGFAYMEFLTYFLLFFKPKRR